jgi:aspartate carbamoyltransferase catalytic subunit
MIRHIVKTQTFTTDFMQEVFTLAREMREVVRKGGDGSLAGKIVATLFYDPSTRTRLSFESAAGRLGATILSTEAARQFSSAAKGESLEDTIRTVQAYADLIILRYHEEGGARRAAHVSRVPIINAGDGKGQHPTQSLLDLFTIEEELGQIEGLKVALIGDLKHGRTVHSLAYLLGKFNNVELFLVAPQGLEMPDGVISYLERHDVSYRCVDSLRDLVKKEEVDVFYQTRIQRERFDDAQLIEDYEDRREEFMIRRDLVRMMPQESIILHPLPRVDEIRYGVDDDPRAKYFVQAENGVYVRMALLKMLLS